MRSDRMAMKRSRNITLLGVLLLSGAFVVESAVPAQAVQQNGAWVPAGPSATSFFASGIAATTTFANGADGSFGARSVNGTDLVVPTVSTSVAEGLSFQNVGTITLSFSSPVRNPVVDITSLIITSGGAGGTLNTEHQLRLLTAGLGFSNVSLPSASFTVSGTTVAPSDTNPTAVNAGGSVQIVGLVDQVTIAVDKRYRRIGGTNGGPINPLQLSLEVRIEDDLAGGNAAVPTSYGGGEPCHQSVLAGCCGYG